MMLFSAGAAMPPKSIMGAGLGEIAQSVVARDGEFSCRKLRGHIQRTGANLRLILCDRLKP
jgi:hypothetical protein